MFFNFGDEMETDSRPAKDVDTMGLYNLLGVPKDADKRTIVKAFRALARTHHPDKGGDPDKFKKISHALDVLSDPDKREIYDKYGEEGLQNGGGGGNANDIISQMFGFGGGGGRGRRNERRQAESVRFPVRLSLEEMYCGTTKKFRITKDVLCPSCNGKGGEGGSEECRPCRGRGVKVIIRQLGPGAIQQMQTMCPDCQGEGRVIPQSKRCKKCRGKCLIKESKPLEVFIKKGSEHGEKITLRGEGDQRPDMDAGDVIIIVQQKPHAVFKREGSHLFTTQKLTLKEALAGFRRPLKHLDDRVLVLQNEPGMIVKPGDVMAIRDEGMPVHKRMRRGDLFVNFEIDFPASLPENVRKLLQKILPGQASAEETALLGSDITEDVRLERVDLAQERKRFREDQKEAYDEDEEHMHGHGGPATCRAS